MSDYPQVVLFGSIMGNWREDHIIPVLDEPGVSYFNPVAVDGWTTQLGDNKADMMAHCETIVMVINTLRPSFTSLAETGWAALGAAQRGQHFILQIDEHFTFELPESIRHTADSTPFEQLLQHWATSSRYLVLRHAQQFDLENMILVNDLMG